MPRLTLSDLTSAAAVQAALDEFTRSDHASFLARHGFGISRDWVVRDPRTRVWADSKAIAGVALAYQYPGSEGLRAEDLSGGEATVVPRLRALGFEVSQISGVTGGEWSRAEVETVVADYLDMLTRELTGQTYNKAAHRRSLGANAIKLVQFNDMPGEAVAHRGS